MKASVRVLFFASLREVLSTSEILVEIDPGTKAKDLIACLRDMYPQIGQYVAMIRIAINQEMAQDQSVLKDGDEIALLMPVSGG